MSRAGDFAIRMAEARAHERTRPRVEVQTDTERINAEVSDSGALNLKVTRVIGVGGDTSQTAQVSSIQAVKLARWILTTFEDPDSLAWSDRDVMEKGGG